MKQSILTILILVTFLSSNIISQTISGKLINQTGSGLSGLQLKLFTSSKTYDAISTTDGSFTFTNISDVKKTDELPTGYSISDNYPNPFNPKTRIILTLPNSSRVNIEVFNLLGKKVLEDIERFFNAGENHIDLELSGLANGIYLARIVLDGKYSVTRKLMLIYGSQHLVSSSISYGSFLQINKASSGFNSGLDIKIDSLVITGSSIKKNSFYNLPQYTGSNLSLGNIVVNTQNTGIPCLGVPTLTYAGKTYNTVQIGTQCWFKENLDAGTMIQGNQNQLNNSVIEKYCYDNVANNCSIYGGLYLWDEAMAYSIASVTKGICPDGWHIPTLAEYQLLGTTVKNDRNSLIAVGQRTGTNTSGFTSLFAGYRYDNGKYFSEIGFSANFWSSIESNATAARLFQLYGDDSNIYYLSNGKSLGLSVRCLKNEGNTGTAPGTAILSMPGNGATNQSTSPTLSWNSSSGALSYTLQVSANSSFSSYVYNQSGLTSTTQQVTGLSNSTKYYWRVNATNNYGTSSWSDIWNFTTAAGATIPISPTLISPSNSGTNQSITPTLSWNSSSGASSYTLQVSISNTFASYVYNQSGLTNTSIQVTGLSNTTTYYWRVSATNSAGTSSWSNTWSFTTISSGSGSSCEGVPTVTYAGKIYNTIQIGNQCWLKENLDVGNAIQVSQNSANNGTIEKYCYEDNSANCTKYGGLYQWNEAMQYSTASGAQGICPSGWHIPTKVESQTLATNVNNSSNKLKAVGEGSGSGAGTNESGFTGLLAGFRYSYSSFSSLGDHARFWNSTEYSSSDANYLYLSYNSNNITVTNSSKDYGYSIRCLKN